jgi:uncharacterized protein involved in exopolysaccharide biosynthesis
VALRLRESVHDSWLSVKSGANHPTPVRLRGQMRTSRESILAELHRIAETRSSDYEIAKAREDALSKLIPEARRPLR